MFTSDAGEVSMAVYTIIEEVGHSLGQQLMVDQDEAFLGMIDTFATEQGAGREVA